MGCLGGLKEGWDKAGFGQKVHRESSGFLLQPPLCWMLNYSFVWRNVSTDSMKIKKKELYKLNGSHWSSLTHSVKKLPQRREQQKFRLQFCGASKQTFFFFFLLQNNLPSFIWQECSCVKPYISQVEKITWIILLANKSVIWNDLAWD